MEATVAAPETHPNGIADDESASRAAQMVGIEEGGQLTFSVGGKRPDASKVQLRGRSVELPNAQLEKGGEVTIQARVRVSGIHFDDRIDAATEQVTGCTRKQVARIIGDVRVVED